jgi:hypothetical protein
VSIFIQSYANIKLHVSTLYRIHKACNSAGLKIVPLLASSTFIALYFHYVIQTKTCWILIFGTFLTLSLKLMQWFVTSVCRGSLCEKFGNKCVKILKFWRTELSYAQSKNRGKKIRLLGIFNLFVSIFIQSYVNIKLHVSTL